MQESIPPRVDPSSPPATISGPSPKRRKLHSTPQRVVLPANTILHSTSHVDPSTLQVGLYLLTESANILCEKFSEDLHGYGLAWQSSDRRHRDAWTQYLHSENLTEESLLNTYHIAHRVGGPPGYVRPKHFQKIYASTVYLSLPRVRSVPLVLI